MNPDDSFPQEVLKASYETTALEIIDREGGLNEQALVDAMARAIPYAGGARVEQWLGQTGWRLGESEIARRVIAKQRAAVRIAEEDGKLHRSPPLCLFYDSTKDVTGLTSAHFGLNP